MSDRPTPLRIVWSGRALHDLKAIRSYVARDDPQAADSWLLELTAAVEKAAWLPRAGRRVPEMEEDVREVLCGSYRIAYRIHAGCIIVATVFEGHHSFPHDAL